MPVKPIVQLTHVTKKIGSKTIIDDLSFDIYPGEVLGLLGPNGAGKTTTIRMIVGLMGLTRGDIVINGYSIEKQYVQAAAHVGAIVENPEMYKFLSGYQNLVHYGRMIKGIDKRRIDEVIRLVGLEKRIKEKVKTYSLGMRQRLGLAQALLHSPKLLILDEPTNGLDPAGIREIREYLRKLAHEENVAVLVSSHLLSEMELMCDRIAVIQNGRLIDVQTVQAFVSEEQQMAVTFNVEPLAEAQKVVQQSFPKHTVQREQSALVVELEREQIPQLTTQLVQAGVRVYGIATVKKSLEDKFIEVTGGKQVV
ncbi:ABC transporter ATP-binding protein [Numidum massiliense]|uniref:ABC transporter ATP-binding protein n=1 Tax=Numidum massiliense TaxID=1522315 RepID=UPI0006D591F4|nr:ABC transporter ATP-binding protein [Numidum massiliense]